MKMWITLAIVALMLIITSATIFLLPKNDEINEFQNEIQNSGNSIIIENEQINESSGDENNVNTETLNNISGEIMNNTEVQTSGEIINNEIAVEENQTTQEATGQKTENVLTPIITPPVQQEETIVIPQIQETSPVVSEQTNIDNTGNTETSETIEVPEIIETVVNNVVIPDEAVGMLNIPKISVNRPILEGHSLDVLKNGLGHVLETAYWQGNIGILGHNSGSSPYFKDLNKLAIGDSISYTTEHGTRNYIVSEIVQIDDTDWSYLANTKDNRITLITCVKGVPEKRLCVQATEIF